MTGWFRGLLHFTPEATTSLASCWFFQCRTDWRLILRQKHRESREGRSLKGPQKRKKINERHTISNSGLTLG